MAEGLEPSISGLTIRRLTNLATPQRIGPQMNTDEDLEARGGVEPRAFRPALRFGLEDRCRERGPHLEAMVRFELTLTCLQDRRPAS